MLKIIQVGENQVDASSRQKQLSPFIDDDDNGCMFL